MKHWRQKFALLSIFLMTPLAGWGTCTATGVTLAFGNFTNVQLTPTTTVTTNCPTAVNSYTVGLETGVGSGATTTVRKMTLNGGSATLNYELFQNSAHTTNWGDTVLTDTLTVVNTGGGNKVNTVFALLPVGQYPAPGAYKDSMTIQVESSQGIQTGTFQISATVVANCTISANPLNFGTYSGSLIAVQSSVSVTCTNTTPYNVGLNAGLATGATVTTRKMQNGTTLLNYNIYRTSGSVNWGNTPGTDTVAGTGSGTAQSLTVFGSLPAGQYVKPGSYTDTIMATITY